jgi:uncharacterized RmlC-like cupin family protein
MVVKIEQGRLVWPEEAEAEVITVRPESEIMSRQQLPYFVGISQATAGANSISMNLVVIPPGGAAEPHLHRGDETAIYLIQGHVETRYGPGLRKSTTTHWPPPLIRRLLSRFPLAGGPICLISER